MPYNLIAESNLANNTRQSICSLEAIASFTCVCVAQTITIKFIFISGGACCSCNNFRTYKNFFHPAKVMCFNRFHTFLSHAYQMKAWTWSTKAKMKEKKGTVEREREREKNNSAPTT